MHEEALHIAFEETESKEHEDEDEDEGHSSAADDMAEYVREVEHDHIDAAAGDAAHRMRLDIDALRLHRSPEVEIAIKWRRRFSIGIDAEAELVVSPCSADGRGTPFSPATSSLNRSRFNSTASDDALRSGSDGAVLPAGSDGAVLSPHEAEPAAQVEGHRTDPPKPSSSFVLDDSEEEPPKPNQHVANVYSQPYAGSNFFGGLALRPSQTLQKRMSLVMLPTTPLGTPASPDNAASAEYAWS